MLLPILGIVFCEKQDTLIAHLPKLLCKYPNVAYERTTLFTTYATILLLLHKIEEIAEKLGDNVFRLGC